MPNFFCEVIFVSLIQMSNINIKVQGFCFVHHTELLSFFIVFLYFVVHHDEICASSHEKPRTSHVCPCVRSRVSKAPTNVQISKITRSDGRFESFQSPSSKQAPCTTSKLYLYNTLPVEQLDQEVHPQPPTQRPPRQTHLCFTVSPASGEASRPCRPSKH